MTGLRYDTLANCPDEVLALTSLTADEFAEILPAFEAAFQQHMRLWRLDGKPRTARRYTTYTNCPLPTPADRLLFILTYLKTYALQVVHGRLFGLRQSKANQWIHVLLPVLQVALRSLGDAPARTLQELAARLGVTLAQVVSTLEHCSEQAVAANDSADSPGAESDPADVPSPLFAMTAPNGGSSAHKMRLNKPFVIAARNSATP